LTSPPQCAFSGLMQNMRSADGFLSIALHLMSSFRVAVTAMVCSGRSFSSSAPFHSKIAETDTRMTLSKRPYMVEAMRCEVFVGYLGRPAFPSCRRSTSRGYQGRAGLDANRDVRLNNAQTSDGGLEEARTVYDGQALLSHSCSLRTGWS